MRNKIIFVALTFCVAVIASASTLTVDFAVKHGIGEACQRRTAAYFVVDRSKSMKFESLDNNRTPNEALLESLKLRLDALPNGSTVFVLPFASEVKTLVPYANLNESVRQQILDSVKDCPPDGTTVLYDAMDVAFRHASQFIRNHPEYEVPIFVYTDGEQETPVDYEGEYRADRVIKRKDGGRINWVKNPAYSNEVVVAQKKLLSKFSSFISKPNVDVEYEWLSKEQKPDEAYVRCPGIPASLFLTGGSSLQNPISVPKQRISCCLRLPVIDKCWEEIKGKNVTVEFAVDGKVVPQQVELKEGQQTIDLEWPSLPSDRAGKAVLSVTRLPSGKKFDLKAPKSIEWSVPAQGKVSVSVVSPAAKSIKAVGEKVIFEAKASDNAEISWIIGGEKYSRPKVEITPKSHGELKYSVTASKTGLKSATTSGTVGVILTGVKVASLSDRHEVNKVSSFKAESIGQCASYDWLVDGVRKSGSSSTFKYKFEKPGVHKIGVVAHYACVGPASGEISVNVAEAQFMKIVAPVPFDGDPANVQFQAEKPIEYCARTEGNVKNVTWISRLKGSPKATTPTVVQDNLSKTTFTPPKGGLYDVVAIAEGPDCAITNTVQIFVKSADVRVDIVNPTANQDLDTDREFSMIASVKGPVKSVRWRIEKVSTGEVIKFGATDMSSVVNDRTEIKAKLPVGVGNARLKITAEPIFTSEEASDVVQLSSVDVDARTFAAISYSAETLKQNWKRHPFGDQVELSVDVEGAIKGESVQWFKLDRNGKEVKLPQTGKMVNVDLPVDKGQRKYYVDFIAKGQLPDGSWIPAEGKITIEVAMPELKAILVYDESGTYAAGGNIRIDGSKSEGFPTNYVWKINGEVQQQFEGKEIVEVDFPKHPTEMVVELTVIGTDGIDTASTKVLKVRLWWLSIPAVVFLIALIVLLYILCLGNGPKHWSFYTWEGPAPKEVNNGFPYELGEAYLDKGVELCGIRKWNYWTKWGKIKLGDMLMLSAEDGNPWSPFSEEEFAVKKLDDGSIKLLPPEGKFNDVTATVNLTGDAPYFLFEYIGLDYSDDILNGHSHVRVRVVTDTESNLFGGLVFLAALGLSVCGFIWFCMEYAI